ncbi:hypothetical protein [Commensalibacter oyaizuii]|uniref:Uncharacterized protein n=1 Tax=Commensalibacter oyaizuii TaxID=3043873 RepID=A0ABT6Q3C9_9PROT|nr:hypothetical protein [Commensalibacter sp. TBRC 16381]MDI2091602.1 hypothetical protein [Commensalibacter sp. TBRC 16381]
MTKIENDGQVVNKEVFKLTLKNPKTINTSGLSHAATILIKELGFIVSIGLVGKDRGEDVKDINLIEFAYFLRPHIARATEYVFTINSLRNAAQELVENGYLFCDKDGTLTFVNRGAA